MLAEGESVIIPAYFPLCATRVVGEGSSVMFSENVLPSPSPSHSERSPRSKVARQSMLAEPSPMAPRSTRRSQAAATAIQASDSTTAPFMAIPDADGRRPPEPSKRGRGACAGPSAQRRLLLDRGAVQRARQVASRERGEPAGRELVQVRAGEQPGAGGVVLGVAGLDRQRERLLAQAAAPVLRQVAVE